MNPDNFDITQRLREEPRKKFSTNICDIVQTDEDGGLLFEEKKVMKSKWDCKRVCEFICLMI